MSSTLERPQTLMETIQAPSLGRVARKARAVDWGMVAKAVGVTIVTLGLFYAGYFYYQVF